MMSESDGVKNVAGSIAFEILNNIDAAVFVADPLTNEILFASDKLTERLGGCDLSGRKFDPSVPFPGMSRATCPHPACDSGGVKRYWEETDASTGRVYKNCDYYLDLCEVRRVYVCRSEDVTRQYETESALRTELKKRAILAGLSSGFASARSFEEKIDEILNAVGTFYDVDRVALCKDCSSDNTFANVYEWSANTDGGKRRHISRFKLAPDGEIYSCLSAGNVFFAQDNDKIDGRLSQDIVQLDSHGFLLAPVFLERKFWGVLLILHDDCERRWSKSDIEFSQDLCARITDGLERRKLERDIDFLRQNLREIVGNVQEGIFWKNPLSFYTDCNAAYTDFLGLSAGDITGKCDSEIYPADVAALLDNQDETVIRTKQPIQNQLVEINFAPVNRKWCELSKVPLFDGDGIVASILGILADVTDKKTDELAGLERDAELESVIEKAESGDRAKSEFLSRMSHEIRTPMNAIIGMTRIALANDQVDKIHACLVNIDSSSKHLLGIINDVLDMSRMASGRMVLEATAFDLEELLVGITGIMLADCSAKNQELQVFIGKDVPKTLVGDKIRLDQILTNLISNAMKFTPENGTIKVSVSLIAIADGRANLEFVVSDNGIGISEDQMSRIFSPFEQANGSISRKYGGVGLGLAICKSLVEMMDGSILVKSVPGKGSDFVFDVFLEVSAGQESPGVGAIASGKELRILFVDDNAETRQHFKSLMDEYNIETVLAEDGYRALEFMEQAQTANRPFNFVFIDWQMPGIDGIKTSKLIREKYGDQAAIVLVSVAEWGAIEPEARAANIDWFISKPLFPSVIINTINEIIGVPSKAKIRIKSSVVPDLSGAKILVVEDAGINRRIIESALTGSNISIVFAENGLDAVDRFSSDSNSFDLILMDIDLPDISGLEATRRIRSTALRKAKHIPIIALTANVSKDDIRACLMAGMNDHMSKPVDGNRLVEILCLYLKEKITDHTLVKEGNSKMDSLAQYTEYLPAIDVKDGLGRVRNNKKLFCTMLKSFKNNSMLAEVIAAIESNDLEKAHYQAHTLKGVAGNLSLKALFEIVNPLMISLKDGKVPNGIIPILENEMKNTMEQVDKLIEQLTAEVAT